MERLMRMILLWQLVGVLIFGSAQWAPCQERGVHARSDEAQIHFQSIRVNKDGISVVVFSTSGRDFKEVPLRDEMARLIPSILSLERLAWMTRSGDAATGVNLGDELQFSGSQKEKIRQAWRDISDQYARLAEEVSRETLMPSEYKTKVGRISASIDGATDVLVDSQRQRLVQVEFWLLFYQRGLIGTLTSEPFASKLTITPDQSAKIRALKEDIDEELVQEVDELFTKYRKKSLDSLPDDIRRKVKPLIADDAAKRRDDIFRMMILQLSNF